MKLFSPRPSSIGHMLTQVTCTIEEQTYEAENIDCTRVTNDMDMAEKEWEDDDDDNAGTADATKIVLDDDYGME